MVISSPHPEESVVLLSGTVENDDGPPADERESLPVGRDPHVPELVRTVNGLP